MRIFFIAVSLLTFSLLVVQVVNFIIRRVKRLYSLLCKHRTSLIIFLIVGIIGIPFVLLFIIGEQTTIMIVAKIFLGSLLISTILGFTLERIHYTANGSNYKNRMRSELATKHLARQKTAFEQQTIVELNTLERFGLSSAVGISFDYINRLGDHFSEHVLLEREIDSLEPYLVQEE